LAVRAQNLQAIAVPARRAAIPEANVSTKRALITGIGGQDGPYLAQHLIGKGYEVFGAARRGSSTNDWRLRELGIVDQVKYAEIELLEFSNILSLVREVKPTVVYNLAAQSFVASSFAQPIYTADADALGPLRILEAIRMVDPEIRFYQASTSEMFGKVQQTPQTEDTPFYPRSPYGVSKLFAHAAVVNYRESYGMHATSGILFNHESPLRGREFVTRKITSHLAQYKRGRVGVLTLGNLSAQRDWGHARDYVKGMVAMTEAKASDSYVLATGVTRTVRDFVNAAAQALEIALEWSGEGEQEKAVDRTTGKVAVEVSPKFYRPAEVDLLLGDPSKAERELGWKAETPFEKLVEEMAQADLGRVDRGIPLL
jgi:GDPmannose 4,6-dehydratase